MAAGRRAGRARALRRAVAALAVAVAAHAAAAAPERWDLRDLYPDVAAWTAAEQALRERAARLDALREGFGRDAASVRTALATLSDVNRELARLWVYADLQGDEDLREPRAQERRQRVRALSAQVGERTAWLAPAVQALGAERVRGFLAADAELARRFDRALEDLLRQAAHTLSPEGEALLAAAAPVFAQPAVLFQQLSDAELPVPVVRLSDGRRVRLTTPAFERHRASPVREDRRRVFEAFFGAYRRAEGSFGTNLATEVMANVHVARARRFDTALEAALFADAMPPAVYRTLVEQARAGLPVLHRYLRLRQRVLGLAAPLAYHDNYPPLARTPAVRWDLDRAKATTLQALAPLGEEYVALLRRGFAARWTDSHPRPGKASGAYVSGAAYDVHPYVLLNHGDDAESLSTLAHEWGHAVHTLLASAAQPFDKAGYSTFIAESASIANEMLLADHLIEHARTPAERRYHLAQAIESIRTTFFRQAMFAEFQQAIHAEVEQARPLSGARLSELYCGIARRYYGQAEGVMTVAPPYCVEWAYVGHFFSGFYVWQYATSMAGAAQFADAIRREGAPARERFLSLLKAGSSDDAYALVRRAGVDLAQPAPYRALLTRMERLMDEFERLSPRR
jgi:oligoendopeptidase F